MGMLAVLAGGVCIAGALGRVGFISDFLSKPILVGYLTGAALILIASQLGPDAQLIGALRLALDTAELNATLSSAMTLPRPTITR